MRISSLLSNMRLGLKLAAYACLCVLITMPATVQAQMSDGQRAVFEDNIWYFDFDEQPTCAAATGGPGASRDSGGAARDQALADAKAIKLTGNNTKDAFTYFVSKGLTSFQSAGILGNFIQESGMDPAIQQGGGHSPATPVNGRGFGIAQWTFTSRQAPLVKLATDAGVKPGTLAVQLAYVWYELNTSHKSALDGLRSADTVEDAAFIFHKIYEVSADTKAQIKERIDSGESVFKKYAGNTAGVDSAAAGAECTSADGLTGPCEVEGPDGKITVGKMSGNEAILACARLFDPYGYQLNAGHEDPAGWMKKWEAQGGFKNKTFRSILDCSSLEMMAIYLAFGVSIQFSTSGMGDMPKYLKEIPVSKAQPGDLMWRQGHTEIATAAGGKKTFGAHTANTAKKRQISDSSGGRWTKAYVYVGEGSTRK